MRLVFFGELNERHLVETLGHALTARGIEVLATGPIGSGHLFPQQGEEEAPVLEALADVIAARPDVVVVWRPTLLGPHRVKELARHCVTVCFLSDDPFLLGRTAAIVDRYDIVLHGGGGARAIEMYNERGFKSGFYFPFWADQGLFPHHARSGMHRAVFLGSCRGKAKRPRYDYLSRFADVTGVPVRIIGSIGSDPLGMGLGSVEMSDLAEAARPFSVGINIPQHAESFLGTSYEFDGIESCGWFEIPSKVPQMAAMGLPVVTLGPAHPSLHFPTPTFAIDKLSSEDAGSIVRDTERLQFMAEEQHLLYRNAFTAEARADYLLKLLWGRSPQSLQDQIWGYRM